MELARPLIDYLVKASRGRYAPRFSPGSWWHRRVRPAPLDVDLTRSGCRLTVTVARWAPFLFAGQPWVCLG